MTTSPSSVKAAQENLAKWLQSKPDTESVAHFRPGPGIQKLPVSFDIEKLRDALTTSLRQTEFKGDLSAGFGAFSLTRRPGVEVETANDLSGLFHTRVDDS